MLCCGGAGDEREKVFKVLCVSVTVTASPSASASASATPLHSYENGAGGAGAGTQDAHDAQGLSNSPNGGNSVFELIDSLQTLHTIQTAEHNASSLGFFTFLCSASGYPLIFISFKIILHKNLHLVCCRSPMEDFSFANRIMNFN